MEMSDSEMMEYIRFLEEQDFQEEVDCVPDLHFGQMSMKKKSVDTNTITMPIHKRVTLLLKTHQRNKNNT